MIYMHRVLGNVKLFRLILRAPHQTGSSTTRIAVARMQTHAGAVGSEAGGAAAASSTVDAKHTVPPPSGPPPRPRQLSAFCRKCGGHMQQVLLEGGTRWREQCQTCSQIEYFNPRPVVGAIVEHDGRILLCRRGIEPQLGMWTVPAGYMELDESSAAGAARETWEEAGARVDILGLFCHWDIPAIGQTYILFRAKLAAPFTYQAQQPESLEARLFAPDELPWDDLAFSSVSLALRFFLEDAAASQISVHHGVINKKPGAGPNTLGSFELVDHFRMQLAPGP